jgi:hypothetical protein
MGRFLKNGSWGDFENTHFLTKDCPKMIHKIKKGMFSIKTFIGFEDRVCLKNNDIK